MEYTVGIIRKEGISFIEIMLIDIITYYCYCVIYMILVNLLYVCELTAISFAGLPGDGNGCGLPSGDVCCRCPKGTPTLIPAKEKKFNYIFIIEVYIYLY